MAKSELDTIRRWAGHSESWVTSFLRDVRACPSIVAVVAIGSAVRNQGHPRSDLDLVVLYRGQRPALSPPAEVDIRLYAIPSVEEKLATGHEVLGWAIQFGIPLYDPEGVWERWSRKYRHRVALPSAAQAADRAERAFLRAREMLSVGDESAAEDFLLTAATQWARQRLIQHGVFPASRPELPDQLKAISPNDPLAPILEDALHGNSPASELYDRLAAIRSHGGPKLIENLDSLAQER